MITVSCNLCKKPLTPGFVFEGAIIETNEANQQTKTVIHACRKCFTDKIKPLYAEEDSKKDN